MAFIEYANISASLPNGHDQALAQRLLDNIEDDLDTRFGLVFESDSNLSTELSFSTYIEQPIAYYHFIKTLSSVTLKYNGITTGSNLEANKDYILKPVVGNDYFYGIELVGIYRYGYRHPYSLAIEGTKGTFEDVPRRLKNAIIDFLYRQLSLFSLDSTRADRFITRAKTGESDVQFGRLGGGDNNSTVIYDSALDDPKFREILQRFYLP